MLLSSLKVTPVTPSLAWPDPRSHRGIIACSASDNSIAPGNARLGQILDHMGALSLVYCKR